MRFTRRDLEQLDVLLYQKAARVVPMRDVWKGDTASDVIGLRHDVDDNHGGMALNTALRMAEWEASRGYSSTYFLLHGSSYWRRIHMAAELEDMGHEVGLHVNGIAEAIRQKRSPVDIVRDALAELREFARVEGIVAHGDQLCRDRFRRLRFVNDEMFTESPRPELGDPRRVVFADGVAVPLEPISRASLGIGYDAAWLARGLYLSDSGSEWSQPVSEISRKFGTGQLHMLVHPDWWAGAFVPERLAA